jgi:hypothetical protein
MDRWTIEPTNVMQPYGVVEDDEPSPPMLDFRGHNGTSFALAYAQLHAVAHDPVQGVRLEFPHHTIRVRGRNLRPLYDRLLRHEVTFIQEEDFDAAPESATFVDEITVQRSEEVI